VGNTSLADETIEEVIPRLYCRRWLMVFLFALYSMTNAYQWIHLNIISDKVTFFYNDSLPDSAYMKEVAVDWLSMVYMLAYIPLIFPVTWLLDKRGLRTVAIIATFLNAVGAWLKCAAVRPDLFPVLIFAQTICAIAQVFILGIPARLAAVWFGSNEVSTATAIGVFGNQIGCALGFLIPPEIVRSSADYDTMRHELYIMFYTGASVTTLLFILVVIFFKSHPVVPPSQAQAIAQTLTDTGSGSYWVSLRQLLLHNRAFLLLIVTYGLNTGSYYAIGTLLNPVVLHYFEVLLLLFHSRAKP
jgi:FLVCR family feline leukemia virus subgroup C receptor-related protein